MKKFFSTLVMAVAAATQLFAMSDREIRENARFLSDRMAYELNLTPEQYEDCYEINYDFIASIDPVLDEVAYGYQDAIDRYYNYLDWRNDDLRMIMAASQFSRFCALEYFYRPIYTHARRWRFRVYDIYSNWSHFYFGLPHVYHTYHGLHSRVHHTAGFYAGRYHHAIAPHYDRFVGSHRYHDVHHHDFGSRRYDRGHAPESHRRHDYHHDARPSHPQIGNHGHHDARPQGGNHSNHEARPQGGNHSNHEARPQGGNHSNHEARPQGGNRGNHEARPQGGNHGNHEARPQSSNRGGRQEGPSRSASRGSGSEGHRGAGSHRR